MNEQFLHYIWKFQYFDKANLLTEDGNELQIISLGIHNQDDAGADFEDAVLKITDTKDKKNIMEWQGTIEIDTYGFNWESHNHATNEAYENVILHVVWKNPKEVYRKNGSKIPVLVLEKRIDERLWLTYQEFLKNENKIACQGYWNDEKNKENINLISSFEKMINRTLDERLIRKSQHVLSLLERNSFDWEETSYQILLEHFGFKKNNAPFLQLAKALPFKIIKKHANQIFQIEALFYGMAGFLSNTNNIKNQDNLQNEEDYLKKLQKEFRFLSHKYSLQGKEVNLAQWKFLRLRPSNFPTVRIAQVIGLVAQQTHLFSIILNAKTLKEFYSFFESDLPLYWKTHYNFNKKNKEGSFNSNLGKDAQQNLIINVIIPIRIAHSLYRQKEDILPKRWLNDLKAEKNNIINLYKDLEKIENSTLKIKTAAQSQSLLELYSQYCNLKKCLSCEVGKEILRREM
ncbi:Protein of unknown function (DUF2851) [Bernardetia litoralis DSM 6794]|uniref:DUF2851 domain-containing protein n=1 Tax=Bernardetia litoralis (strain ATCC 23117 / DSM 6794 / NBRC 15988 / NCIMB 1366 / Fx l1 / Sio-4) TaxID=880071 RepID=I4AQ17_BERLS|nr:DUF2851 family protein [Bernardetia litoralis]AFM06052.1 Protein of unknown function (DUF2851) [Bernardetia litoralis DSM 6794]